MAFLFIHSLPHVSVQSDWNSDILDQEKLVILFINYMFFSVIIMVFMLFLMCLTQLTSFALEFNTVMTLLPVCFIVTNIVIADYLTHTMHINREIKTLFN